MISKVHGIVPYLERKWIKYCIRQLIKTAFWIITIPISIIIGIGFLLVVVYLYLSNDEETIVEIFKDEWPVFREQIAIVLFARKPK